MKSDPWQGVRVNLRKGSEYLLTRQLFAGRILSAGQFFSGQLSDRQLFCDPKENLLIFFQKNKKERTVFHIDIFLRV